LNGFDLKIILRFPRVENRDGKRRPARAINRLAECNRAGLELVNVDHHYL
jgi:hypothetical protein